MELLKHDYTCMKKEKEEGRGYIKPATALREEIITS